MQGKDCNREENMALKCESCGRKRELLKGVAAAEDARCMYCGGRMLPVATDGEVVGPYRVSGQFLTACPFCKNVFEVCEEYNGHSTTCPECGSPFVIARYVPLGKLRKHDKPVRIELPSSCRQYIAKKPELKSEETPDFSVYTPAGVLAAKVQMPGVRDTSVEDLEEYGRMSIDRDSQKLSRCLIVCGMLLGCVLLLAALAVLCISRANQDDEVAFKVELPMASACQNEAQEQANVIDVPEEKESAQLVHANGMHEMKGGAIGADNECERSAETDDLDFIKTTGLVLPNSNTATVTDNTVDKGTAKEDDHDVLPEENAGCEDESRADGKYETIEEQSGESKAEETASPMSKYLVMDLSQGPEAEKYSIQWLDTEPAGGWSDIYKTAKLVLRRVEAGPFMMGSPEDELGRSEGEQMRMERIYRPYYIGVFEVTRKQYQLVTGKIAGNPGASGISPAAALSWEAIRGNRFECNWPSQTGVYGFSFMGLLRRKTGLENLDLPTEAQWEYACRAGTDTAFSDGSTLETKFNSAQLAKIGRYVYNPLESDANEPESVGSFLPNAWGLYDMHGNVWEWCLDSWDTTGGEVLKQWDDSVSKSSQMSGRVVRGGSYASYANGCRSASRSSRMASGNYDDVGFRICCEFDATGSSGASAGVPKEGKRNVTGCRLFVGRPNVVKKTVSANDSGSGFFYRNESSCYVSISKYNGNVGCNVSKGWHANVKVEAYFVTKGIGDGMAEGISAVKTVGTYLFGEDRPNSYEFAFDSPEVSETKASTSQSGTYYNSGYRKVTRTGTRYLGVIVRMIVDGEVKKVVSVPNNHQWNKAGRQKNVVLE